MDGLGWLLVLFVFSWLPWIAAIIMTGVVGKLLHSLLTKHLTSIAVAAIAFLLPLAPLLFQEWREAVQIPGRHTTLRQAWSLIELLSLAIAGFEAHKLSEDLPAIGPYLKRADERSWAHLLGAQEGAIIIATVWGELLGIRCFGPAIHEVIRTVCEVDISWTTSIFAGGMFGIAIANVLILLERKRLIRKGGGGHGKSGLHK